MNNSYKRKCCICHKPIEGTGHNSIPVWPSGRCCDKCFNTWVLPTRYALMKKQEEESSQNPDPELSK